MPVVIQPKVAKNQQGTLSQGDNDLQWPMTIAFNDTILLSALPVSMLHRIINTISDDFEII